MTIILSIVDIFNLSEKIKWLQIMKESDYPIVSVGMLSLIALHLAAVHTARNDSKMVVAKEFLDLKKNAEAETAKIIQSLNGVQAQYFENMTDLENYLAAQLLKAKREVCDLSWKEAISENYNLKVREESRLNFETNIKKISEKLQYREIFIFNDRRRLQKLKTRIAENVTGYSCRYFPTDSEIPRLQFVIIDESEIIFASSSYPKLCAIQHPELCSIFKAYYNSAWNKAIPIKMGDQVDIALVEKLLSEIS